MTQWRSTEPQWHLLSYEQWQRAGSPTPRSVDWVPGSYVYKWSTGAQVGVVDPLGKYHWLTPTQWAAMGWLQPHVRSNEGFIKLTWSAEIMRMTDIAAGAGHVLDYSAWRSENFPTPLSVQRVPGDAFTFEADGQSVRYSGPTTNRVLTYSEWQAAGSPAPTRPTGAATPWPANRPASTSGTYHPENGQIGAETCILPFMPTHRLHCRAMNDTIAFNEAFRARFGMNLPIDPWTYSTYRSVADQQVVRATVSAPIVASPGTSPHGWGLAIDFLEGPSYSFGSTIHTWPDFHRASALWW